MKSFGAVVLSTHNSYVVEQVVERVVGGVGNEVLIMMGMCLPLEGRRLGERHTCLC